MSLFKIIWISFPALLLLFGLTLISESAAADCTIVGVDDGELQYARVCGRTADCTIMGVHAVHKDQIVPHINEFYFVGGRRFSRRGVSLNNYFAIDSPIDLCAPVAPLSLMANSVLLSARSNYLLPYQFCPALHGERRALYRYSLF